MNKSYLDENYKEYEKSIKSIDVEKYFSIFNEIYNKLFEIKNDIEKNRIIDQYDIYKHFSDKLELLIDNAYADETITINYREIYTYTLVNFYNKLLIQMTNYIHIILSDNIRPTNATIISNIQNEIEKYKHTNKYYKYKLKYLSLLNNLK